MKRFLAALMLFSVVSIAAEQPQKKPAEQPSISEEQISLRANSLAEDANRLSEEDLSQQKRMADSTVDMAQYSLWGIQLSVAQLVLSIVGAAFLFWTLWETRKASRAAIRSADAAQAALSKDRPYMLADSSSIKVKFLMDGTPEFKVRFTNYGSTPATNAKAVYTTSVAEHSGSIVRFSDDDLMDAKAFLAGVQYPGATITSSGEIEAIQYHQSSQAIPQSLLDAGLIPVNIHAFCTYSDLKGKAYSTEFLANGIINHSTRGLSFAVHHLNHRPDDSLL